MPSRTSLVAIAGCVLASCGEPHEGRSPPLAQTSGLPGQAGGDADDPGDDGVQEPDADACSPYADPLAACGATRDCSFADGTCQDAFGTGGLGESCTVLDAARWSDTCLPELVCTFADVNVGRCLWPCDPGAVPCSGDARCIPTGTVGPRGLCFEPCDPLLAVCPFESDACYPQVDDFGRDTGACLPAGLELTDGPCTRVNDCLPGSTCTAPELHSSGCGGNAGCCAALCDVFVGDCFGADFACLPYANPASPNLGVCSNPDL